MTTNLIVSLALTVRNEAALRAVVREQLLEANIDEQDADPCLDPDKVPLAEIVRLAIDPGTNPPGCEIQDSWATLDEPEMPQGVVGKLMQHAGTPDAYIEMVRMRFGTRDPLVVQNTDFDGPAVWIGWIESRAKGAGKVLMERVCANADRHGILLVAAMEDNGSGKLLGWYEQFGFVQDPAGGEIIERLPRATVAA